MHRRAPALLAVMVVPIILIDHPVVAQPVGQPDEDVESARAAAAKRTGGSKSEMTVLARGKGDYPLQGKTVHWLLVENGRTGAQETVNFYRGREISQAQLDQDEVSAYLARYGRLQPELAQALERQGDDAPLPGQHLAEGTRLRPARRAPPGQRDDAGGGPPSSPPRKLDARRSFPG